MPMLTVCMRRVRERKSAHGKRQNEIYGAKLCALAAYIYISFLQEHMTKTKLIPVLAIHIVLLLLKFDLPISITLPD